MMNSLEPCMIDEPNPVSNFNVVIYRIDFPPLMGYFKEQFMKYKPSEAGEISDCQLEKWNQN